MALSKDQLTAIRGALGLPDNVPDADIEELAGSKAGAAFLQKVKGQGQYGLGTQIMDFITGGGHALNEAGFDPAKGTKALEKLFGGISGQKPAPKKADPKKTAGTSEQDALQQLAQYLTSNYVEQGALAMGQQGQELAQMNKNLTGVVDQYISMAGGQSGSPAVAAAMNAYSNAYSAGEGLQSAAYANMGAANAQYLQESPLYPVANLLTQGFGSTQYKQLPASTVQGLPPNVQAALAQAGVTESTPAGGTGTPITVPKGASGAGAQNLAQILGLNNQATNPNINTSLNQTLTPGNAAVPGQ